VRVHGALYAAGNVAVRVRPRVLYVQLIHSPHLYAVIRAASAAAMSCFADTDEVASMFMSSGIQSACSRYARDDR